MYQEYSNDFVEAVVKEVNGNVENAHGNLVPIEYVPKDTYILTSV